MAGQVCRVASLQDASDLLLNLNRTGHPGRVPKRFWSTCLERERPSPEKWSRFQGAGVALDPQSQYPNKPQQTAGGGCPPCATQS